MGVCSSSFEAVALSSVQLAPSTTGQFLAVEEDRLVDYIIMLFHFFHLSMLRVGVGVAHTLYMDFISSITDG